jgi:hypothetical protein
MTITPLFTGLLPWTDLRVRPLLAWLSHSWCAVGQGIGARFVNLSGVDGGPCISTCRMDAKYQFMMVR